MRVDGHGSASVDVARQSLAASEELDCSSLTDEVAGEFLRARRTAGYRNLLSPRALVPLLDYLRSVSAAPEPVARWRPHPRRSCCRTIAAICWASGTWWRAPLRAMRRWPAGSWTTARNGAYRILPR
jgi:hypothetical protein